MSNSINTLQYPNPVDCYGSYGFPKTTELRGTETIQELFEAYQSTLTQFISLTEKISTKENWKKVGLYNDSLDSIRWIKKGNSVRDCFNEKETELSVRLSLHYLKYAIHKMRSDSFDLPSIVNANAKIKQIGRKLRTGQQKIDEEYINIYKASDTVFSYTPPIPAIASLILNNVEKIDVIEQLLNLGESLKSYTELSYVNTPMHAAVANAESSNICRLIDRFPNEIDFNATDGFTGGTCLHLALIKGRRNDKWEDMVDRLITNTQVNIQDSLGNTPLHYAFARRDVQWVKQLITKGADLEIANKNGVKPAELWKIDEKEYISFIESTGVDGPVVVTYALNERATAESFAVEEFFNA